MLLLSNKLIEKILDPCNAKEHYQSSIRKKNLNSVKESEIITYHAKTFENPNFVDIKLVIIEHPKTLHKLYKTVRQAEKVGTNSLLYSDTKKSKIFLNKKSAKITKPTPAFKGFGSSYNVEILDSCNPEMQFKDLQFQSAI